MDIKALLRSINETFGVLLGCALSAAFVTGVSFGSYYLVIAIWGEEMESGAMAVSVIWTILALLAVASVCIKYQKYKRNR